MSNWNNLNPNARLWFYVAKEPFTPSEVASISSEMDAFCNQWLAHNKKVNAGFLMVNNQVLILAADNSLEPVSGCSIDSSVHFMQQMDSKFGGDLFNRMRALSFDGKAYETIQPGPSSKLTDESILLNIWAQTKQEFETNKHIPIQQTWLKKYLKSTV